MATVQVFPFEKNIISAFSKSDPFCFMRKIDFHGCTTKETLEILRQMDLNDKTTKEFHLITGRGTHTKNRPQMDYFLERSWNCPVKKTVIDYITHEKKEGARMYVYPAFVVWRRKLE